MADPERHVPGEDDDALPHRADRERTELTASSPRASATWWTIGLVWGFGFGIATFVLLVLLTVGAIWVVTNTDWGRDRVRRFALREINKSIHGKVTVRRISGNLLLGLTAHDIAIVDTAGQPFITAESAQTSYSLFSLIRKRIWLQHTTIVRPVVTLDRKSGEKWNFKRIFPQSEKHEPDTTAGWGDWLSFTDSRIVQGTLIIRTPWHPRSSLSEQAKDSVANRAVSGKERLVVERVSPRGYQKIVRLDSINARVPQLMLAEPDLEYQFATIAAARFRAVPFHPPTASVRDLNGLVKFTNDSAWWSGLFAALPDTRTKSTGTYSFENGDLHLRAHAEPAQFADLRWAYPDLPPRAHGKFDLQLDWVGSTSTYRFTNGDIWLGEAHGLGSFGITFDDTTSIHHTHTRFTDVTTGTLSEIFPDFSSPRSGSFSGTLDARGGLHALNVDGDITFDDNRAGRSRAIVSGQLGFPDVGGGIIARDFHVRMLPMKVEMARTWFPTFPLAGEATGPLTIDGRTNRELRFRGTVDHVDRGAHSVIEGTTIVRPSRNAWVDVDVMARPLALAELGRYAPSLSLRGYAIGPIRATGTLDNVHITTDARLEDAEGRTSDAGRLDGSGTFDFASKDLGYDFSVRFARLNLAAIAANTPHTSLNGTMSAHGVGVHAPTADAVVSADLSASRLDSIAFDSASIRGSVKDGLVHADRVYATGASTSASVSGTFGLTRQRGGTLTYRVTIDSLGAYNRWVPRVDTAKMRAVVSARPRVRARAIRRAKADSTRRDRATELERFISGKPAPKLDVKAPKSVRTDTLAGSLHASGTIRGNIYAFDLRGRANGEDVVARGNAADRIGVEYAWINARTSREKIAVGADVYDASIMGFAFDTLKARVTYADSGGHAELVAIEDEDREFAAKGDYSLNPARNEVRLTTLALKFDTTYLSMTRPATFRWGPTGIHVGDFELRDRGTGRLYVNGLLPDRANASLEVHIENFPVSAVTDILQTEADVRGRLTLHGELSGTLAAPEFEATFAITRGRYNGAILPESRGRLAYANRAIVGHVDFLKRTGPYAGQRMAMLDGRVPINLALQDVQGSRISDEQMAVRFVSDSLPLELIPELTDAVSNVHGQAGGTITILGTLRHPLFAGGFRMRHGTITLTSTGATFENLNGAVHLSGDTVYVDSIAATARGGAVRVRGIIGVADWREPTFRLALTSRKAELMHNDQAHIKVDADLHMEGKFDSAHVRGDVTIVEGVIYAPETTDRHVINADDPALFNVIDTALTADRELFPPENPLLANMTVDVALAVRHNTWVRNREANVEIYTDDPILVRAKERQLALTGVVTSDRGSYNFLSKRFQIKRGAAIFIGDTELNPTVQVTGEYEVQLPSRGALNIRVLIGGTLRNLTLSLESDAQPPRTQSELLSLLAFGQSSTSLLATGASSIAGSAATSDLFGVGAQVAARRLAGVALGVAANQVEMEVGKAFGTDIFDISPTDVPSGNIVGNLLTQTRFEGGKYINPRTFMTVSEQAGRPGFGIEHRTSDGWQFTGSIAPRILLREPTLRSQPYRVVQVYGFFVIKEWRW